MKVAETYVSHSQLSQLLTSVSTGLYSSGGWRGVMLRLPNAIRLNDQGNSNIHCAANFSFAQLATRKSLGRSKPATNS